MWGAQGTKARASLRWGPLVPPVVAFLRYLRPTFFFLLPPGLPMPIDYRYRIAIETAEVRVLHFERGPLGPAPLRGEVERQCEQVLAVLAVDLNLDDAAAGQVSRHQAKHGFVVVIDDVAAASQLRDLLEASGLRVRPSPVPMGPTPVPPATHTPVPTPVLAGFVRGTRVEVHPAAAGAVRLVTQGGRFSAPLAPVSAGGSAAPGWAVDFVDSSEPSIRSEFASLRGDHPISVHITAAGDEAILRIKYRRGMPQDVPLALQAAKFRVLA